MFPKGSICCFENDLKFPFERTKLVFKVVTTLLILNRHSVDSRVVKPQFRIKGSAGIGLR